MDDVEATLLIAFLLVVAVIFVFLGRATDTLIPAVALPMSLLLTFMAMRLLGYSLDNLSLMALTLAIGFLVDDAIVFLENTVRLMEKGMPVLEATLAERQGNQLYDSFDDDFARRSFLSAGIYVRTGGPHLPRIRHHHRCFHLRVRPGFADAYSADVREASETKRARHQAKLDRAHHRQNRKACPRRLRKIALVVFAPSLDLRAHVGFVHGGHGSSFHGVPKSFLPVGDSGFIWGVMIGKEGSSPQQMQALQTQADAVLQQDPAVGATFTMTGNNQFLASNQGLLLAFLRPTQVRSPIQKSRGE